MNPFGLREYVVGVTAVTCPRVLARWLRASFFFELSRASYFNNMF